jgi:hypothetical protein
MKDSSLLDCAVELFTVPLAHEVSGKTGEKTLLRNLAFKNFHRQNAPGRPETQPVRHSEITQLIFSTRSLS